MESGGRTQSWMGRAKGVALSPPLDRAVKRYLPSGVMTRAKPSPATSLSAVATTPPTSSAKRTLTPRGQDRRDALIAFATTRFAQNGFHPTSVSEIVDGVGVGKGVFYWYFRSKDELLLEILGDALYKLRRTQKDAIRATDDPIEALELGIRSSLRWSVDHPEIIRLVMFAWTEESFAKDMRKGREIMTRDTARHIERAMDLGLIERGDARIMATAVRGVSDELGRQYAISGEALNSSVIDAAVRFCLRGVVGNV